MIAKRRLQAPRPVELPEDDELPDETFGADDRATFNLGNGAKWHRCPWDDEE